jgi:hypothetical protein
MLIKCLLMIWRYWVGGCRRLQGVKDVFVVAGPRSGTTWLSRALNAHPSVLCTERRLFGQYAEFLDDLNGREPRLRITLDRYVSAALLHQPHLKDIRNKVARSFISSLRKAEVRATGKRVLVDKITPYVGTSNIVADGLDRFFPRARIVYLLRDGRDVATSGVFHWFDKKPANTEFSEFELRRRAAFRSDGKMPERFSTDEEVEEWAKFWAEPLRTKSLLSKTHQILVLRYEDMLIRQQDVLRDFFRFCKVPVKERQLVRCVEESAFKKMSGNRERGDGQAGAHVRKGVSGDWKIYFTKRDGELFHRFAGDILLEYSYVSSANWYMELPVSVMRSPAP